jgi:NADH dehydrogenase [ubiquinone] 1 alpha subcomplex assembly factor 7
MTAPATDTRVQTLLTQLRTLIAADGPITVAHYMAACLFDPKHGYYSRYVRLGARGDFVTAPEVSQMYGELIGLMCVQIWQQMGAPDTVHLIEMGPGRGVLMADLLRAAGVQPAFLEAAHIHLVEMSTPLRKEQAHHLKGLSANLQWADSLRDVLPGPCIIIGNEFLDCLPIRQFVRTAMGWRERLVSLDDAGELIFVLSEQRIASDSMIPPRLRDAPEGSLVEVCPQMGAVIDSVAKRLKSHPGVALFVDYGPSQSEVGDTLQAIVSQQKTDPLSYPGFCDITARVDFESVIAHAVEAGLYAHGPVPQGRFLKALGIDIRAANLIKTNPDKAADIAAAKSRLCDGDQMGHLFKVLGLSSQGIPTLPGL